MSLPAAGLPNQRLRKQHNARRLLYTNKKTSRGVLLKSCQKQLKVTTRAGVGCDLCYLGFGAGLIEAGNRGPQ